jgi:hypothetical protein
MNKYIAQNEHGVSLIVTIVIGMILSTIGYVTMSFVIGDSRVNSNRMTSSQAFWVAEAGLEMGFRWLRFQNPPPGGSAPFTQFSNAAVGTGAYTVTIDPDDGNVDTYLKAYKITATGEVDGLERTLSISVEMTTFGCYAYLSNDEGNGTIWIGDGDVFEGPVHSNDQLSIRGSPIFMGKVTSSASSFNEGNGYAPDFQRGYQLDVPPMSFPTEQDLINNYYASNNNQDPPLIIDARFNKDAEILFNSDGTITYSVWHMTGPNQVWDIAPTTTPVSSLNGLIYVKGDVFISGLVNGQVTLIATKEIYITDDILYADSDAATGQPAPGTSNLLGLISLDDIVVTDSEANRTDCRINGALLAIDDEFTVEHYASGNPRGTLTIWGSLSEYQRGPVGTLGNSSVVTGYNKDYHHEARLLDTPPPYYPVTGQYSLRSWNDENQ